MDWNTDMNKALVRAFLALKTPEETRRFLRDLMTEGEIEEFGRRFSAARMLSSKVPYSVIEKKTGLSSTTIARVSKWLNGSERGYKTIIARTHHYSPSLAREE